MPTRSEALAAIETLLAYIGDNPLREGLRETPDRVLKAWEETWGAAYRTEPPDMKMFSAGSCDEIVMVRDIRFCSMCEHHMAPFYGKATVGYIPGSSRGIVGISKLARAVTYFSHRLQVQEHMTTEIADFLFDSLAAKGVGVIIRATHMCMVSRGVSQPGSETVTSALRGVLFTCAPARSEFLGLVKG